MTELSYKDVDFAARARELVASGKAVSFEVAEEAFLQLLPHLTVGKVADPAKLGLKPKLQPLLGVLMVAEGLERNIVLERRDDSVLVQIGAACDPSTTYRG